ncbi:MAG: hypothetical protein BAJATHORv1_50205 [Candidatus Thorarchaeota archaeon]|nr:MAG: hypothetical protein BAJATHORv1_50205 [Candidatus Thorarchaeota archaeon]
MTISLLSEPWLLYAIKRSNYLLKLNMGEHSKNSTNIEATGFLRMQNRIICLVSWKRFLSEWAFGFNRLLKWMLSSRYQIYSTGYFEIYSGGGSPTHTKFSLPQRLLLVNFELQVYYIFRQYKGDIQKINQQNRAWEALGSLYRGYKYVM